MALTDADRLQMVAMALMRHSVFTTGGGTTDTGYYVGVMTIIPSADLAYTEYECGTYTT